MMTLKMAIQASFFISLSFGVVFIVSDIFLYNPNNDSVTNLVLGNMGVLLFLCVPGISGSLLVALSRRVLPTLTHKSYVMTYWVLATLLMCMIWYGYFIKHDGWVGLGFFYTPVISVVALAIAIAITLVRKVFM